MGCAGSKPAEDQPAVVLCRRRCEHLQHAIGYRYDFANAHAEYLHSLRNVGEALSAFFLAEPGHPGASPVLTLPDHYKTKGVPPPVENSIPPISPPTKPQPVPIAAAANRQHSRSNSGSHLHFMDSESDSDDGPLHSDHGTPYYQNLPKNNPYEGYPPTNTTTTTYFNYAQKAAPAAVTYEQRPYDLASVQLGTFTSSGGDPPTAYPYGDAYPYSSNPNNYYGAGASSSASSFHFSSPYQYPTPYGSSGGGGAGGGGFFDPSQSGPPHAGVGSSSSSAGPRAPPPPPSPPKASAWDFINVFDSYDSYYPNNYTPSRSSRDLREEEGIPELEEEDQEVVKEGYVQAKSVGDGPPKSSDEGPRRSIGEEMHYRMRPVPENDVAPAVDKSVAAGSGNVHKPQEAFKRNIVPGSRSLPDTVQVVKAMFERSSMVAEEVRDVLEVGKIRYHQRRYQVVPSKLMRPITSPVSLFSSSSLASTAVSSQESDIASSFPSEFGEPESNSLSCILHKLSIWETKLLDEVKAGEDMQMLLEKKRRKLKRLDDKGAEASKIDATRKAVKNLSTRIRVAIHVVENISHKISLLRGGELWKELQELIQGLVKIWKAMTECHRIQCEAIIESRSLDVVHVRLSDAQSEAIMQLVLALHRWSTVFSNWVNSQKLFVHALNDWLKNCIRDEPEETVDGLAPFSPGRLGAPTVFVICNSWVQALQMISDSEVVHALGSLEATMKHIWDRHCEQVTFSSRPGDRGLKDIETKRQKLLRELEEAPRKKQGQLVVSDVNQPAEPGNLKSNLQQVFEAMERFTDSSTRAYEGLWTRCVEENMLKENAGPS